MVTDDQGVASLADDNLALNSITASGTTITVNYTVGLNVANVPFRFGLYNSSDRLFGGDTLLSSILISAPDDLTAGPHTKTYAIGDAAGQLALPGAGVSDSNSENYLLGVLDDQDSIDESEADPFNTDNTTALVGVYAGSGGTLLIQAGAGDDAVSLTSSTLSLTVPGFGTSSYSLTGVNGVRIRTHEGNDTVSVAPGVVPTVFVLGSAGDDTLTTAGANVTFDGGAGTNTTTVNGTAGNDVFTLSASGVTLGSFTVAITNSLPIINGQAGNDTFTLDGYTGTGTIIGGGDNDAVYLTKDADFTLSNSQLTVTGGPNVALAGVTQAYLTGGTSSNLFTLNGWTGTGSISGGGGGDRLLVAKDADITLNDSKITASDGLNLNIADIVQASLRAVTTTTARTIDSSTFTGWVNLYAQGGAGVTLKGALGSARFTLDGYTGTGTIIGSGHDAVYLTKDADFTLTNNQLTATEGPTVSLSGVNQAYLTGGASNNTLTLSDWTGTGSIAGGGGSDKIVISKDADITLTDAKATASDGLNVNLTDITLSSLVAITTTTARTIDASAFSGTSTIYAKGAAGVTLKGGAGNDNFMLDSYTGTGSITSGGGINSIFLTKDADFTLTNNQLTATGGTTVSLSGVNQAYLTGGVSNNSFTLNGWTGTGIITGGGGSDKIVISKDADITLTNPKATASDGLNVNLTGITLSSLVAITTTTARTIDASAFSGTSTIYAKGAAGVTLKGGAGNDNFMLDSYTGTGSITSGGGINSIFLTKDADFTLSNSQLTVTGGPNVALAGVTQAYLTGGTSSNLFTLNGWTGTGSISGGGGGGGDRLLVAKDADITLNDSKITASDGLNLNIADIVQASLRAVTTTTARTIDSSTFTGWVNLYAQGGAGVTLKGALGSARFTLDGYTGTGTIIGSGHDAVYLTKDADFTLTNNQLTATEGPTVSLSGVNQAFLTLTNSSTARTIDASSFSGTSTLTASGSAEAQLIGGSGNDTLNVTGSGTAIVLGGAGDDILSATGAGRVVLIGGSGADTLHGNGMALQISSSTAYDSNSFALDQILAEWSSLTTTYAVRVSHILNGGGLNGTACLTNTTVMNDSMVNVLSNSSAADGDWFVVNANDLVTSKAEETKTIIVHVDPIAPLTQSDNYNIAHGKTLTTFTSGGTLGVLGNDSDLQHITLTASILSNVQHGTLVFNSDGSFTYTPNAGYYGSDSFIYQASNGLVASAPTAVSIMVSEAPPVATDDTYNVTHDQTLTANPGAGQPPRGVLSNDHDGDGDAITSTLIDGPFHGTLTFLPDGSFVYIPNPGFGGTDSFTYQDSDGLLTSAVATATINVTETAPIATNSGSQVSHDITLNSHVRSTDADNDTLTYVALAQPQHGTLALNTDGTFVYIPSPGYSGTDSFTYQASDGLQSSNVATVTIDVTERAPVVKNDSYTVAHDRSLSAITASGISYLGNAVGVLGNDTDADGDKLTSVVISGVQHGTLTFHSDGTFVYTPTAGYAGPDSFTYCVSDGLQASDVATVTLFVSELPPTAEDDVYTVVHDQILAATGTYPGAVGVLSNDSDSDSDPINAVLLTGVQHGTLIFNTDGTFTYVPTPGFSGSDQFTYQDSDGVQTGLVATVTITVTETAPVAVNDSYTITHDQTFVTTTNGASATASVLANDTNSDNDVLTATLVTSVQQGSLTFNADGTFVYFPAAGYSGTDSFTYRVSDGLLTSDVATVTLNVAETAPVAMNDSYTVAHDHTLTTTATISAGARGVLSNDSDADHDTLTVSLVAGPQHGTLSLNADGMFVYTPIAGYSGTDSFTYRSSDGRLTSSVATVTLNITETAPVAVNDSYTIAHAHVLTANPNISGGVVGVLANDTDADQDTRTASLVAAPQHGTLSFNADGTFIYIPNTDYTGADSFTYRVSDGLLTSAVATVTLNVTETAPVAVNDSYTLAHDHTLTTTPANFGGTTVGVLGNDTAPDQDALTASLVVGPQHGTLSFNADGSFIYTPAAGYSGTDSFTYRVSDGTLSSAVATVTLNVSETAPVAMNDSYTVAHDHTLTTTATISAGARGVLSNDSDADHDTLTVSLVAGPQHGTLSLNADGSFAYAPNIGYTGADSFTYRISDGLLTSAVTTATLNVTETAPVAVNDSYTVVHDHILTANPKIYNGMASVLGNDTDADQDWLTASLVTGPAHGTLALKADGSFIYIPLAGYTGTDSFTYQASDGAHTSGVATATISVTEAAPVAVGDTYKIGHNHVLTTAASGFGTTLGVLANDMDSDSDKLTATVVSGVQHGTLTFNNDGTFTYVPAADYSGTDSFTYQVSDGRLTSSVAIATIAVTEVAPVAVSNTYTVVHDQTLSITAASGSGALAGVLGNDTDADGDTLTATLVSGVQHGTLTFNANGTFTYVPTGSFSGTDSFTYQVSDGMLTSTIATATITVGEHVPVVTSKSYSVAHDQILTGNTGASDSDNDTLTTTVTRNPQHGTVTFNTSGQFTYTPDPGYSGPDSFAFQTSDGILQSNVATITISVTERAPAAISDTYDLAHDHILTTPTYDGLLYNDHDADGDRLTIQIVTGAQHGILALNADGTFTYVPNAGYIGVDTFTYRLFDGLLQSNVARATINVGEHTPVAIDDSYTIIHDQSLVTSSSSLSGTTGVRRNDTDADGDTLAAVLVTGPQHGTLSFNADGTFVYKPAAGYSGVDSFTYRLSDGTLTSNVATATINVAEHAPAANNDVYTLAHDQTLTTVLSGFGANLGVLSNDTDSDNDVRTASLVTGPQHGTLTFNADGTFRYTPAAGYAGTDSFTYRISDGILTSGLATATIRITESAPLAIPDTYTGTHDHTLTAGVLTNDTDSDKDKMTAVVVSGVQHGMLSFNADGTFVYTPTAGYSGVDSFTYRLSDGALTSNMTTATINIAEHAPIAVGGLYSLSHDRPLTINGAGTDSDRDLLTGTILTAPQHGTASFDPTTGKLTYTPAAGYSGVDSFTYELSDGLLASNVASVTIAVGEYAPVAFNDTYTLAHDQVLAATRPSSGVGSGTLGLVGNDTDIDGDKLTAMLVTGPQHGTLLLNADGTFAYVPNAGYSGPDSFTYKLSDGLLTSNVATASIVVTEAAPVAQNDAYTVTHDQTLIATSLNTQVANGIWPGALANDVDFDGDRQTATLVTGPQHGTLLLNADGTFAYIPNAGYSGPDSFTYKLSDGLLTSNVATASIVVTEAAPVAQNDSFTIGHDRLLTTTAATGVLSNDSDADNETLTATLVSGVQHGTLAFNADGSFNYIPDAGFVGTDSFTYRVSDGLLTSAAVTAMIRVTQSAPSVVNDTYTIVHDHTLTTTTSGLGATLGVLANDSDADGDLMTATVVTGVQHGTLTFNADGSFTYLPDAGYSGPDSFTYRVSDGTATSAVAIATINVTETAPVATGSSVTVAHGQSLTIHSSGTDAESDEITASIVTVAQHGTVTANSDGTLTYTPAPGYFGPDSFSFQLSDGLQTSSAVTVNIIVTETAPVAVGDSYSTKRGTTLTVAAAAGVLTHDTDADNDPKTVSLVSSVQHGTLTLNTDGSFSYTPATGYTGPDSFTYRVSDGLLSSNVATVVIEIYARAPITLDDSYSTAHDHVLNGTAVLANDLHFDGGSLTATLVSNVQHGTLTLNADGTFVYTPATGYSGTDSFTYQAFDGALASNVATVTLTVTETAPVATGGSASTPHDKPLTFTLTGTDTESDHLTPTIVSGPQHGTLTPNANGTFTYTPTAGYTGADSFTYRLSDGLLSSSVVTESITVNESAPIATNDSYSIGHDRPLTVSTNPSGQIGVLANDHDSDNDTLTVALVTGPQHGKLTLNADGSFTYTPNTSYTGTDSFTYRDFDGLLSSSVATATITVTETAPVASGISMSTPHDKPLTLALTGTDAESDHLTPTIVSGPQHGTLTPNANGTFTYTPTAGFTGPDSFTYRLSDGLLSSSVATESITITESAPIAANDNYAIGHDRPLTVFTNPLDPIGVLSNDIDANNDTLTVALVTGPQHGTLTLNANGSFTYTPNAGYTGTDSFTYRDSDGLLQSNIATVTINVVEHAPITLGNSYTIGHDHTLTTTTNGTGGPVGVLSNDTDADTDVLTATLVSGVQHGTLTLHADGTFVYVPAAGYSGADKFTYRTVDSLGAGNVATVQLLVTERSPESVNDAYSIGHDRTLTISTGGVLANDADSDLDPLSALLVSNVQHGTLTLHTDGTFVYTPAAGYSGTDSFTYRASDGLIQGNTATVTIIVKQSAPVAYDASFSVGHDRSVTKDAANGVLYLATDADQDALTASLVTGVSHGTLTFGADGSFVYTPAAGFSGTDRFTYQASDGLDRSQIATISLTITQAAPIAIHNTYTIGHDEVLTSSALHGSGVLANDTDPDDDAITASLVTNVQHGALTFEADGSFTYTPAPGFTGTDSFTYRASDGLLTSDPTTVTITITEHAPIASADVYNFGQGQTFTIAPASHGASGILFNDNDPDKDTLTASLVSGPQHGTLTLNTDGTFSYTPAAGFIGTDVFTYRVSDGMLQSGIAVVALNVTPNVPAARADTYTVGHDRVLTIQGRGVLTNDNASTGGALTAALVSGVQHGTLTLNSDGSFTYTPAAGFIGTDSFTYRASGDSGASPATTVTLTVAETAPAGVPDSYTVAPGTTLTVAATATASNTVAGVLANDSDAEGDTLSTVIVTDVRHGALMFYPDGSFNYTPAAGYSGTDSFTYRASDGHLTSDPTTVTINVAPLGPVAVADEYTTSPGQTLIVNIDGVLANDIDTSSDGGPLTATLITNVQHGTLTLDSDGTFTYTPAAGFVGTDSFTYQTSNGLETSASAMVTLSVVAEAATASDDSYRVTTGQTLLTSIAQGVQANDSNPSGTTLTTTLVSGPYNGTLALQANGIFSYTPRTGFVGTDSFTYKDVFGTLSSNVATVTITVNALGSAGSASGYGGGSVPFFDSATLAALFGSTAGSSSTNIPGLVPYASSAFGMGPGTGGPTGSSSMTAAGVGGNGVIAAFGTGFADLSSVSGSSISDFFGPGFHGYGSILAEANSSLFHGVGSSTASSVGPISLVKNGTGSPSSVGPDYYGGVTYYNGIPYYGGTAYYGAPGYSLNPYGYNGSLGYAGYGPGYYGYGLGPSLDGLPGWAVVGSYLFGNITLSNSNDTGSWTASASVHGSTWTYEYTSTSQYDYTVGSTEYSGSVNTSLSWSETRGGNSWTYEESGSVASQSQIETHTSTSSATGWNETDSVVNSSVSISYQNSAEGKDIPYGYYGDPYHYYGYLHGYYGGLASSNFSDESSESHSSDVYQTGGTSTSLAHTSFTSSLSSSGQSSSAGSFNFSSGSTTSSSSASDSGSNRSSYDSEGDDSFQHIANDGSSSDYGTETTTQYSTLSSQYSDEAESSSYSDSVFYISSSLTHSDSGSTESGSHTEGTVTYQLSSAPSAQDQATDTTLETFLETEGTETFSTDGDATGNFSNDVSIENESGANGTSGTTSSLHTDDGSRSASSLLQGNASFSATTLDPSSGDTATDDGSEDYSQSYAASVDYSDRNLTTSGIGTGSTTTLSHFDSGDDDASVDIRGNDTFDASSTDPLYGETDTDTGSENFTRGLASSDTYSDKSVNINGNDGKGHASSSFLLKHTDSGSVEGNNGLQGNDTLFVLITDPSTGEIDTTQEDDQYNQEADSSLDFENRNNTDRDTEAGGTTVTSSASHFDTGNDSSYSDTQTDETDTSAILEPNSGAQSGSSMTDRRIDSSSTTLQYVDQGEGTTFTTGTLSSTTADSSHSDTGSNFSSFSDSGTDSSWDFFAHGGSDSDAGYYSLQTESSDQYSDESSTSMTAEDSVTHSSVSTSSRSLSTETYISLGGNTSYANSADGMQPSTVVSSYSHQENREDQVTTQSESSSSLSDGVGEVSSTTTDEGTDSASTIDWSNINETDTFPDRSDNLITGVSVTSSLIQSGSENQYEEQSSVVQKVSDGTVDSATSLSSGSSQETNTQSLFEQESETVDSTSQSRSSTKNQTSSENFSDQYDDGVASEDGDIIMATSSSSHVDTSFDSTSLHERHSETQQTSTGTTVHNVDSDNTTSQQASNQNGIFTSDLDGVLSGWIDETSSSSEVATITSIDVGSFWDAVGDDFGLEQITGSFNDSSSTTRSDDDWSSASLDFNDDVTTGFTSESNVETVIQTSSNTSHGEDLFRGIVVGDDTYAGTGSFNANTYDWISSTSQDLSSDIYGASGPLSGAEHWTNVSQEIWNSTRHDVDDLSDQNGNIGLASFDSGNSGTQWTNGSDQNGTTLARGETWPLVESDGHSTYTETTTDNTSDVFANGGGSPTSSGTPTTTHSGTEIVAFIAVRTVATLSSNQGGETVPGSGATQNGSDTSPPSQPNSVPHGVSPNAMAAASAFGPMSPNAVGSTSILYNGYQSLLQQDYLGNGQYAIYYVDKGWIYNSPPVYVGNLDQNTGLVSRNGKAVTLQAVKENIIGNGLEITSIQAFFDNYSGNYVDSNSILGFAQDFWNQFLEILDIFPQLTDSEKEATLDFVSTVLSIVGIFDPTPTADGLDLALSVYRKDLSSILASSAGMVIPYLGDAAKLPLLGGKIAKAQEAAKVILAKGATPFSKRFADMASYTCEWIGDKIQPLSNNLPKSIKEPFDEFIRGVRNLLGGCFAAGTPLLIPGGSKLIEEFQEGDYVLSAPEDDPNAIPIPRRVESVFHNFMPLLELRFGTVSVKTTIEHPFWVEGRGWVLANMLEIGDRLRSADSSAVVLTGVEYGLEAEAVYNLQISEYHTYYVGTASWGISVWSHNSKACKAISAPNKVSDHTHATGKIGGQPTGMRAKNKRNANSLDKRGIRRENESADTLAKKGYKVQQNPVVPSQSTNPDFRIEGRLFDNYAPITSDPRAIVDEINKKVAKQAPRIVLNLADTNITLSQLRLALQQYGSSGLQELIVIDKFGDIIKFFP